MARWLKGAAARVHDADDLTGAGRRTDSRPSDRRSEDEGLERLSPDQQNMGTYMSIIGWIVLGLISGFIASKIVNKSGEGALLDIILGIVGAIVGGLLFNQFGAAGVTGFNLYSMGVAIIGAIVVLVLYHAVAGRRSI